MKQKLWFARLFGIGMFLTVLNLCVSFAQETPDRWKRIGPWGGDIRDIKIKWVDTVFHTAAGGPYDSVLIASYGAGIFITDSIVSNGSGTHWIPRNNGLPSLKVNCIGVRRLGLGDTLYAGLDGYGIYKSYNGGLTWERGFELGGAMGTKSVYAIAVHPHTSWIAYAATNDGLYKTTNFGVTWSLSKNGGSWKDVTLHEYATQKIFAVQNSSLYRSTDGGTTWGGPYAMGSTVNTIALAYSALDTLYAGLADGSVKEVTFPGDVFTVVNKSNGLISGNPVNSIVIIPQRSSMPSDSIISNDTLYIGTDQGMFKSDKKGATWTQVNVGLGNTKVNVVGHYYDRDYTESSTRSQNLIYVGTRFNGFYKASTNGTGTSGGTISWTVANDSLPIGGLRAVNVDPENSDVVFVGGGYVLSNGQATGALWKSTNASSTDNVTWSRVLPSEIGATNGYYIKSIAQPWGNSDVVLVADSINGIYRSTDGGSTWTLISNTAGASYVYFDRMHKDTAFAARKNGTNWKVLRSFNGGATFTELSQNFTYPITSIIMDSAAIQYLYVTTWGGGVYRSTNLGSTFTQINNGTTNLNVYSLGVDKDSANLYIGTEYGLYRSTNRGTSWIDNNSTTSSQFGIDKVYNIYSTRDSNWTVLGSRGHFEQDKPGVAWVYEQTNGLNYSAINTLSSDTLMLRDLDFIWKWTEGPNYNNVGYSVSENRAVHRRRSMGGTYPILNGSSAQIVSDTVYIWLADTCSAIRGQTTDIPVFIKNGALVDSFRVAIHLPYYIDGSTGQYEFRVDTVITEGTLSAGRTIQRYGVDAGDSTYVIQSASTSKLAGDGVLFKLRVTAYALDAAPDSLPRAPHNVYSADSAIFIWNGRPWATANYTAWDFSGAGPYDSTDFGYDDNGQKIPRQVGQNTGYVDSLASFWFRKLPAGLANSGLNGTAATTFSGPYANPGDRAGNSTDYNSNNFVTERLWQYTKNTGRSMLIGIPKTAKVTYPYLTYGTISGNAGGTVFTGPFPEKEIRMGDAIGAFYYRNDSLVCAGWGTWDPSYGCVFTAWGDDDRTPLKDGFVTNEKIILKVYDSRYKMVWDVDNATVSSGGLYFTPSGITQYDTVSAKYYQTLTWPVHPGWNLLSSYIVPARPEVENIFKDPVTSSRFVLMKDETGLVYWPQIGLNQIINWDVAQAYWVYFYSVAAADAILIRGTSIDVTKNSVKLNAGWNLLPYWGNAGVDPVTVLASISGKFTVVKSDSGHIYWPELGFNTITKMWPGKGYEIYMTEAADLVFPTSVMLKSMKSFNGRGIPEIADLSYGEVNKYNAKVSPISQVIAINIDGYKLSAGDEIGAFTKDGICVGSTKISKGNISNAAITIFGDMPLKDTDAKSGAVDGDELIFKIYSKSQAKEYTGDVSGVKWIIGEGNNVLFKANTIGSVKLTVKGSLNSQLPTEYSIEQNYPNPFNPSTKIKYAIPVDGLVKIKVFDMLGREIKTLVNEYQPAGYYTIEWDATNNMGRKVSSGVYFYQIESNKFTKTIKMMLMK
ncbi:MAG TPA: T9SS type A sorting domain-containing protein [Ignavibacteria bacterium]